MIIKALLRSLENPSTTLADPDAWLLDLFAGGKSASGVRVGRETAITIGAVYRAAALVSGDVAKLPLFVYKRLPGGGKERAKTHPAYKLLRYKANQNQTAYRLKRTLQWHAMMVGNGYAFIDRSPIGVATALIPLLPQDTWPIRENGVLFYMTMIGGHGHRLEARDVIHIAGPGWDGLVGYSVIEKGAESIGLAMAERDFGSRFFSNDARPGMVLEHPARLKKEAKDYLRDSWEEMHRGIGQSHRLAILEEGMKVHTFGIPARDAQLIDQRGFEVREIANFFGVPSHKLGDPKPTAFASLEQENQQYLDEGLDPWLVNWEDEHREKMLTDRQKAADSHVIEFLRQAIVRADLAARTEAYNKAIMGGWMNPDEARDRENLNPMPNGEGKKFLRPANMVVVGEQPVQPAAPAGEPPDDDDQGDDEGQLDERHAQLVRDALLRLVRRISVHASRAARKPDLFVEWIETLESSTHKAVGEEILEPIVAAAGIDQTLEDPISPWIVRQVLDRVEHELLDVAGDCRPDELAEGVDERMLQLQASLPGEIACDLSEVLKNAPVRQ